MATTEQIQAWLSEAESAYRALMTGKSVVEVRDSNGETVRFSMANASRLKSYIAELKAELAGKSTTPHRVMRPTWG